MNSFKLSLSDLIKQRTELENAEQALKNRQLLIHKRESLEKAIVNLQEEIEEDFHQFHNKGKTEGEAYPLFQNTLCEKQKHLRQLKQAEGKLDELLDQTEDMTHESLEQQRNQLIFAIWQLYPSQRKEQEAKWKEINHLRILDIELHGVEELHHRLFEHLSRAIQVRQSIKGRGILNYIFGTSPNMIIEQQLLGAHTLIVNTLPLLQKMIHESREKTPLHLLSQEIYAWLERLKTSCHSPWSFRHIDTIFSEAHGSVQKFLNQLKIEHDKLLQRIDVIKKEMEGWVQQLGTYSNPEDEE